MAMRLVATGVAVLVPVSVGFASTISPPSYQAAAAELFKTSLQVAEIAGLDDARDAAVPVLSIQTIACTISAVYH